MNQDFKFMVTFFPVLLICLLIIIIGIPYAIIQTFKKNKSNTLLNKKYNLNDLYLYASWYCFISGILFYLAATTFFDGLPIVSAIFYINIYPCILISLAFLPSTIKRLINILNKFSVKGQNYLFLMIIHIILFMTVYYQYMPTI